MTIELLRGCCLEKMAGIETGSIDLILADPPYGTTACSWDSVIPLDDMWTALKRVIKPRGAIVLTASQPFTTTLIASNMRQFKYCWVWLKNTVTGFPNAKRQPLRNVEDVVVFYDRQCKYNPFGIVKSVRSLNRNKPFRQTINAGENDGSLCKDYTSEAINFPRQVLEFNSVVNTVHATQKPVALMEYLIRTYTDKGETVLDFCMGSGSTGVAARNLGRSFIGIERDDANFDIANKRILENARQVRFESFPS